MRFTVKRDSLLSALQSVAGAVERRNTHPILANTLFIIEDQQLSLVATDLEIEMIAPLNTALLSEEPINTRFTVTTRKLIDICRTLPEEADIGFTLKESSAIVTSGRSRFTLATLPAQEFPRINELQTLSSFTIKANELRYLFEKTAFAMGQQDIRYYLNGLLLEITADKIRTVATDGHRLSLSTSLNKEIGHIKDLQLIIPRKAIMELMRLLVASEELLTVTVSEHHIRIITRDFTFTSKLIDGQFPAYEKVLPQNGTKEALLNKDELKQALNRAAVLANSKLRGACIQFRHNKLHIVVNNTEYEEAEIEIDASYENDDIDIGLNINYLQDVLTVIEASQVKLQFADAASRILITEPDNRENLYVIMPMRV